jgi:hypothetical protein
MKKLFACLALLYSTLALSATTLPVQLINPSGSSSGQAIVSTGSGSAPAWTTINAATLNGATFASPPSTGYGSTTPEPVAATTISATGLISPSTTNGIKGTTAGDNANAGSIGEIVIGTSGSIGMTASVPANITSITLTAGDWEIWGNVEFDPAASTTASTSVVGVNSVSATLPASPSKSITNYNVLTGQIFTNAPPVSRYNITSTTTFYLVADVQFSVSTMAAQGFIAARRRR